MLQLDFALFNFINGSLDSGFLDVLLIPWRTAIYWLPLYVFFTAYFFFKFGRKGYYLLLFCLLTVASTDLVSSRLIKPAVERLRPCHEASPVSCKLKVRCGSGYSFTSSHAANHFGLAAFLFIVLGVYWKRWKHALLIWAALVGFAQVYVGVHFPSDVLVGSLLGAGIGYGWAKVFSMHFAETVYAADTA